MIDYGRLPGPVQGTLINNNNLTHDLNMCVTLRLVLECFYQVRSRSIYMHSRRNAVTADTLRHAVTLTFNLCLERL